jgi:AcrR family transcriptional regulator
MPSESSRIGAANPGRADDDPPRDALRADARRNRERILAAARDVFAERGIDAPMAAVARRAGVGVATLYRRFPARDDLVRTAYSEQMQTCAQALAEAVRDPDPWRGLQRLVETVCELQRRERGFPAAFVAEFPDRADDHAQARAGFAQDVVTLIRRAQAAGRLRPDLDPSDLGVLWFAHGGLVAALPDDHEASRRLIAYFLDAFRAAPTHAALPPPSRLELGPLPTPMGRPSTT